MKDDVAGGPIRWRMHLLVPPENAFEALDSNEGRVSFWAESAVDRDGAIEIPFTTGTPAGAGSSSATRLGSWDQGYADQ